MKETRLEAFIASLPQTEQRAIEQEHQKVRSDYLNGNKTAESRKRPKTAVFSCLKFASYDTESD